MVLRALGSVVGCFLWSCALRTIPLQPTSFFPVPSHYRVMSKQERVAITKQNYTVPLTPIKKKNYRLPSFPMLAPAQPETLEAKQYSQRKPQKVIENFKTISHSNCF